MIFYRHLASLGLLALFISTAQTESNPTIVHGKTTFSSLFSIDYQ